MSAEPTSEPGQSEVRARLLDNPFYVLELGPDCSRAEVERAGQKLLAMLEIDLAGARSYTTPFGSARRDAAKVREAMAQLRDPQRRLFHELWALGQPWTPTSEPELGHDLDDLDDLDGLDDLGGFGRAHSTLGWRS
jgi:hypothetical protein